MTFTVACRSGDLTINNLVFLSAYTGFILKIILLETGVTSRPLTCRSELAREHRVATNRSIREQARSYRRYEGTGGKLLMINA